MIYTIGHTDSYEEGFLLYGEEFRKLGRIPNGADGFSYQGGSVFKTIKDAAAYLKANQPILDDYSVYGVLADWDTQTVPNKSGVFHDLLVTSTLVKL